MSLPKLNDFIGKGPGKVQYKRVSMIHQIKNSLARNTIIESSKSQNKAHHNRLHSTQKTKSLRDDLQKLQPPASFKYEQKVPTSFVFSTEDMYKLLEHLFNKKQHDLHDRNFIRRLMLKYFPEELICAGGRDFVSLLKFDKLRKGERKIFDEAISTKKYKQHDHSLHKSPQRSFFFVLKGRVRIFTEQFTYKKESGQYFGELQILGSEEILEIEAKSDTMLLILSQQLFNKHLAQYFINIYAEIRKKTQLFEPVLNLAPLYNQLRFLELLYEKEYKTGDKIIQKGDQITEIVFLNHAEISSTEDKLLKEFKTVGLGEILAKQKLKAKQTTFCMDNKTVYAIKAKDLMSFIDKEMILSFISQNYNFHTLSGSKLAVNDESRSINTQNSVKMDSFVNVKRVRFTGNKRRVLTEPNLICMGSPSSSKKTPKYPEYATSFVFIKENSSTCFTQMKSNRFKGLTGEKQRKTDIKECLLKTRDSFKKKRWLDEIDNINLDLIICNPEKLAKYDIDQRTPEIKEFTAED